MEKSRRRNFLVAGGNHYTMAPGRMLAIPMMALLAATAAVALPYSAAAIALPAASPAIALPAASPAIALPAASPAIALPAASPAIALPATSPAIALPAASPDVALPAASPDVALPAASPDVALPMPSSLQGSCTIEFAGTSTLHHFSGHAKCQPFVVAREAGSHSDQQTWQAEVSVHIADMDTGNGSRDRNMRKMFEVDRYPLIEGRFHGMNIEALRLHEQGDGTKVGELPFTLRIHGVEEQVTATVTNWQAGKDGHASFDAEFSLSLEAFGMKPPTALLFIKVGDTVTVHVHAALAPS